MLKRIFIKTAFLLFIISNMFANANDVAGLAGVSEAAGNSAQAAADQLSSDAGKVAANLESATEALGEAAFIGAARTVPLRNMGAAISPFNSFLILQGIETLPVRMDRHCENAIEVAKFLKTCSQVTWVNYPGLEDHVDYPLVKKLMNGKASSVLSFGIDGGRENGGKFIDNLELITRLVNIGDAKSLACHPASTTHRQL